MQTWGLIRETSKVFRLISNMSLVLGALLSGHICLHASSWDYVGPIDMSPQISLRPPPSFVVREHGILHHYEFRRTSPLDVIGPVYDDSGYHWKVELLSGPDGMTLSDNGILSWVPDSSQINDQISFSFRVDLTGDAIEPLTETYTHQLDVLETFPELVSREEVIVLRGRLNTSGRLTMPDLFSFVGYEYNYATNSLMQWSLRNAPPGLSINNSGYLQHSRSNRVKGLVEAEVTVKAEQLTPNGWWGRELQQSIILLPAEPFMWRSLGGIHFDYPRPYGHLGFSVSRHVDGLFAAGEPGMLYGYTGKVRVYAQTDDINWNESIALTIDDPDESIQALGASVALSQTDASSGFFLAAGAPESVSNQGKVAVWASDQSASNWDLDAIIEPPLAGVDQYFGGWVDLNGGTLIASIEGDRDFRGALAIYKRGDTGWSHSQTLRPSQLDQGDYFSYPCAIDGDWIVAAANEDDEAAHNAGAVYLYELDAGVYVLRQKILSPMPVAGALFGERVLLSGNWLFVSAFRENELTGAVYVFRNEGGTWSYYQELDAPFATAGSRFGTALSLSGNTLVVTALAAELFGPLPDVPAWGGITRYGFDGQRWVWENQRTSGGSFWSKQGWSLAQISESQTVVSSPAHEGFDGALFLLQWRDDISANNTDLFQAWQDSQIQAGLSSEMVRSDGDLNANGIPNLIEWSMGAEPATTLASSSLSNVRVRNIQPGWVELEFPELVRGFDLSPQIEYSHDLVQWEAVRDVQWLSPEQPRQIDFEEVLSPHYIQPVRFPWSIEEATFFRLRMNE